MALLDSTQYIGLMLCTARSWLAHQAMHLPAQCRICGLWFLSARYNRAWCSQCELSCTPVVQRCAHCAAVAPRLTDASHTNRTVFRCASCATSPNPWQSASAAVSYAYPWAGLIAQFKYQRHAGLAKPLAKLMADSPNCSATLLSADLWMGVPINAHKLGIRGFNQTQLLLDQLAATWPFCAGAQQWPVSQLFASRHQHNPNLNNNNPHQSQLGLGRRQRLRNLVGAFELSQPALDALKGQHVVLVDDVYTTGATLTALAKRVQQASPASVQVCVLARTPPRDAHNES